MKQRIWWSMVTLLLVLVWLAPGIAEQPPASRGELRVVDRDPFNWLSITWNVMEHLIEHSPDGTLVPRLATGWRWLDERTLEVTLRQGVRFHNGEVFDAEIVKLNWDENTRFQQPHLAGTFMNFKPGSQLEIVDPYTVRFVSPEADGGVLTKLLFIHMANRQFYRDVGWGEKSW